MKPKSEGVQENPKSWLDSLVVINGGTDDREIVGTYRGHDNDGCFNRAKKMIIIGVPLAGIAFYGLTQLLHG